MSYWDVVREVAQVGIAGLAITAVFAVAVGAGRSLGAWLESRLGWSGIGVWALVMAGWTLFAGSGAIWLVLWAVAG